MQSGVIGVQNWTLIVLNYRREKSYDDERARDSNSSRCVCVCACVSECDGESESAINRCSVL